VQSIEESSSTPSEPQAEGTERPHPPLRRGTIPAPETVLPTGVRHEIELATDHMHSPGEGSADEQLRHPNHENALHLLEMVVAQRNSGQFI
jgi:hypothetical protein